MRQGNTTEQAPPWRLGFAYWRFQRLPKYDKTKLVYLHLALKFAPILFLMYQHWIQNDLFFKGFKGFYHYTLMEDFKCGVVILLCLIDFQVTKSIMGPRLAGLHHGFKKNEETGKYQYHYHAEQNFLTRYSMVDRDSFFTFMVMPSGAWFLAVIVNVFSLQFTFASITTFGFLSVYMNLYFFVQARYYQLWDMNQFFSAWAFKFFIHIRYEEGDIPESSAFGFMRDYRR